MSGDRFRVELCGGGAVLCHDPDGGFSALHPGDSYWRVLGAIRQQASDIAALKDALADEVTANEAFRKAGGARDDEDMPTFCARLIAERDTLRAKSAEYDLFRKEATKMADDYLSLNGIHAATRDERDTLRAYKQAVEAAPTVVRVVEYWGGDFCEYDELPPRGTELIVRPAKDAP